MSEKTGIAWTDSTWNPGIFGCKEVSPGCANCYAAVQAERLGSTFNQANYAGLTKPDARGGRVWTGEVRVVDSARLLEKPLHWREPRMIFTNSMTDLFHEDVPDSHIDKVLDVMRRTPQHTYQTLTKRPERMRDFLRSREVLPNAWWGTSVEDQERADERIPLLLDTPAAVRFISAEPLLGPLELSRYMFGGAFIEADLDGEELPGGDRIEIPSLDWIIVGGESGPHRRPFDVAWAQSIYDQCHESGVAYFGKQTSAARSGVELPEPLNEKSYPEPRDSTESLGRRSTPGDPGDPNPKSVGVQEGSTQ